MPPPPHPLPSPLSPTSKQTCSGGEGVNPDNLFTFNVSDFNGYSVHSVRHFVKLRSEIFKAIAFHCCDCIIARRYGSAL